MKIRIGSILVTVVLLLAVAGVVMGAMYYRPLAQPLQLQAAPTETAATTQQPGLCGLTGSMTIINLGLSTEVATLKAAESIRLVRINFDQKKVMVFSLPRDIVVKTPALKEKYNLEQSQLGDIYKVVLAAEKKSAKPEEAGFKATQASAQIIYDTFGVVSDHYLSMDNQVMWDTVDILGGITVKMKQDFKAWEGAPYFGLVIKQGEQKINGLQSHALYVMRDVSPEEWDRTERQNVFWNALFTEVMKVDTVAKVPELYQNFKDRIWTDLSPAQIVSLACVVKQIPLSEAKLDEVLKTEVTIQNDGSFLLKDIDATKLKIQNFLANK